MKPISLRIVILGFALSLGVGCDNEPPEPPAPSDRTARPLAPIQIEVETSLREIQIELERLESLQADESTAKMVALQPEQLRTVSNMIEDARKRVDVDDERASGEFEAFRGQAIDRLERFRTRLDTLQTQAKKEAPASAGAP